MPPAAPFQGVAGEVHATNWVPTRRGIYYLAEYDLTAQKNLLRRYVLNYFEFSTRRTTQVLVDEAVGALTKLGLSVSPDERWLIYEQRDRLASDLVLVENFR